MPRFVIERVLGAITDEQLAEAADTARRVREEQFPEIGWEHSHVVRDGGTLKAFCVYSAPTEQQVRDHAVAAGLPADRVTEIHADLVP